MSACLGQVDTENSSRYRHGTGSRSLPHALHHQLQLQLSRSEIQASNDEMV